MEWDKEAAGEQVSVFSQSADVRRLVRPKLSDTYVGNATAPISTAALSVDRLCSTDSVIGLAEAACAIRCAEDAGGAAAVGDAVNWLGERADRAAAPALLAADLHVENVSKVNFYSVDFGTGKPDGVRVVVGDGGRLGDGAEVWFLPVRFDADHAGEFAIWMDPRRMDLLMADAEFRKCFREITDQPAKHKHGEPATPAGSRVSGARTWRTTRFSTRSDITTFSKKSFFG